MPKCSTCAYEIPKHATNCSNCGYLVAPLAGSKEQTFAQKQSSEAQVAATPAPVQVPLNPQTVQHSFDLSHLAQATNQQSVQQPMPQVSMPFQVMLNPVTSPNAPPNIEQFQQKQQQMPLQPPVSGVQQPYGAVYPQTYSCQPPAPVVEQKSSDVSALSVFSLALGIIALISSCIPFLGLPFGIGGIICGLACRDKMTKGASMALVVTGVIFSVLGLLLSLAMLLFWITEPSLYPLSPEQFIF